MSRQHIITFSLITLFVLHIQAQVTEKNYRIYSVKLSKEIGINEIVEDMNNADVLFYGEEHNDSVTHFFHFEPFKVV